MRFGPVAAVAVALAGLSVTPAVGQECHGKVVKAIGSPALIEATAKSRARSAWIKKVRADRRLGPGYAAWLRSKEPSYACRKAGKQVICEAIATPCKV